MEKERLYCLLSELKNKSIAVVGDYCLDEYLHIDPEKNEPSLETGLVAYQIVKRETSPGAAGTIAKNLAVLGVGTVYSVGIIGDDGRGLELKRGLKHFGINDEHIIAAKNRETSTYTKPLIIKNGAVSELNRLDIKNWTETPRELEDKIIGQIQEITKKVDAIIIMDQLTERNCGVVTDRVRDELSLLAQKNKDLIVYADSRAYISKFKNMIIKGNRYEIVKSVMGESADAENIEIIKKYCLEITRERKEPVFVTMGEKGALIAFDGRLIDVPVIKVSGEIDICGAGDAFTSGTVSALSCGAELYEAGLIGSIVASICITQIGTTGSATSRQVINKFMEI